jgi:hypothetical protein
MLRAYVFWDNQNTLTCYHAVRRFNCVTQSVAYAYCQVIGYAAVSDRQSVFV